MPKFDVRDIHFNPLINCLTPAEGEIFVKNYHITCLKSRILGLEVDGFLSVTNKRVIFYAMGSSGGVMSVLDSEVPIDDVSGINCYKGHYLSILHLLGALLAIFIISGFLNTIVGLFQLTIIYNANSTSLVAVYAIGLAAAVLSVAIPPDKIFRCVLAAFTASLFAEVGGLSLLPNIGRDLLGISSATSLLSGIDMIFALFMAIYALVSVFKYAQRETISLAINSKSGSNTPISISGVSSFSISNTAAIKALTADPAKDADVMIKELGALILDIQTLGDEGIPRWNKASRDFGSPVPVINSVN